MAVSTVNTVDVEFTIKMNDCNPGSTIKRWDLPNGESFNTPTFSFAQKSAHVQIFPDGDRDENRGCVSVFLVFEPAQHCLLEVTFSMTAVPVTGPEHTVTSIHRFGITSRWEWGWWRFLTVADLRQRFVRPDGSWLLKVTATLNKATFVYT
eukprot:TRINITY_DN3411_c0_g1_i8.p1 TRINITY_DN3411_c0_g1~~TRINITY_DN3411_c0_g1_i8.p1  ORF type:complete len:151 (-),score=21.90 TRINITY_DN3411_c0_g1_i8:203-655(-)